jgi:hypothetical protein
MITGYAEGIERLEDGKDKLASNTYLEVGPIGDDGSPDWVGVRLYRTIVVTFYRNGDIELYSGGYKTRTTKRRIHEAISRRWRGRDWSLFSERGVWYVGTGDERWEYADNMILHPDGSVQFRHVPSN